MTRHTQLPVAVRKAIGAGSAQLAEDLSPSLARGDKTFNVHLLKTSELGDDWAEAIWRLTESNMRDMAAQSSLGWDADEKRKELFHADARFIVLSLPPDPTMDDAAPSLVGFTMFRFDYEEGEKLLYCYEVQLTEGFRQLGLGSFLIQKLIRIGRRWKMEKVMLTVLKVNVRAAQFYRRVGFTLDPSSPDYVGEDEDPDDGDGCDYEIFSVDLVDS